MTTRRSFLEGAAAVGIAFCGCVALKAARAQEPERRRPLIMLGSDHPFGWEQHQVDHIFATTTLPEDERAPRR